MKIGLYSPFMAENIGGGERYLLTVAECLLAKGNQVDLIIQNTKLPLQDYQELKQKYINSFNLDLKKLNIIPGPFDHQSSFYQRWQFTRGYDAFYYITDGSFFIPGAKRNAVHFMIPFKKPAGGLFNYLKLKTWQIITTNSNFTKKQIEKNWHIKVNFVHLGAVDKNDFQPSVKKKIILNVGRFFTPKGGRHCKRQDLLVEVFKTMCDQGLKDWKLILNGPIDKGRDNFNYAQKVAEQAKGYPIELRHEGNFKVLQKDYGHASIYWHATGFGLSEDENPEAMEHLGMTTIEAMLAGSVPIVISKAGQKEIVTNGKNGFLWQTKKELISKTWQVIKSPNLRKKIAQKAQKRAEYFSKEKFCLQTSKILSV